MHRVKMHYYTIYISPKILKGAKNPQVVRNNPCVKICVKFHPTNFHSFPVSSAKLKIYLKYHLYLRKIWQRTKNPHVISRNNPFVKVCIEFHPRKFHSFFVSLNKLKIHLHYHAYLQNFLNGLRVLM